MKRLGLGLASLGMLTLQIAITRVFSLLVWYHFAFLAIALALLGFTAGGVIASRSRSSRSRLGADVSMLSYAAAAGTVLALLVACRLPFGPSVVASAGQIALFITLIALLLIPFVLIGVVVASTLASDPDDVPRLYFADLVGSGIGCILCLLVMDHLGGGAGGVLFAATAFALAGIAFDPRRAARGVPIALACGALLFVARQPLNDPFYLPNAKLYPRVPREMILKRKCTSLACVDFFQNPAHFGLWGMSSKYKGPFPEQIGVVIDAWAVTSIVEGKPAPVLEALPPAVVHHFLRLTGRTSPEELVIGAGGGLDVRTGLHFGAKHIDAVDINPTIVKAVAGDYDTFAGGLYHRPDVKVAVAEGRHFLRRAEKKWDLVQISGVDTYAASQAGAFALTENYLYTVEAMREVLSHLRDDGTLAMTRWLYKPPRQTLRLSVILDEAMRSMGVGDARERVVVIGAPVFDSTIDFSIVLARRMPFTQAEVDTLAKLADAMGYYVVYAPGKAVPNAFTDYFASTDRAAFVRNYPFRIDANTDDKPFFFEHYRWSQVFSSKDAIFGAASGPVVLLVTFLLVTALALLLVFRGKRLDARGELYFVSLGLAYIGVELWFIPRFVLFLGHPSHALSVVLFAMLMSSGVGSFLSSRVDSPRRVGLAIAAVLAIELVAAPAGLDRSLHQGFMARVLIAGVLVALPSLLMGMMFPLGLRGRDPAFIARAWVLNGSASVVASVGAMVLAIGQGFSVVLLVAAAFYVVAALVGTSRAESA
jgi:spermidine synthase